MRARTTSALLALGLATVATTTLRDARANGNESHGATYEARDEGVGITSAGVGLSGRRAAGANVPITTGTITLAGVPAGATILKAYLYWVVYGDAGDAAIKLNNVDVAGTLIGTSHHTCWAKYPDTYQNRAYRAEVPAIVTGNGTYTITDFYSAFATEDTQGASIVVVYQDPTSDVMGSVFLRDGAITVWSGGNLATTFDDLSVPAGVTDATLTLGVGDGQDGLGDGVLRINGDSIQPPVGGYFKNADGTFWDDIPLDVLARLPAGTQTANLTHSFAQDCLVFAYSAIDFHNTFVDDDEDGIEDSIDNCVGVANSGQENDDTDSFGNACDNCPDEDNDSQFDEDEDGVGNACDVCISDPDPDQVNTDGDQYGDVCDNCPLVANDTQIDSDGDDVGDACEGGGGPGTGGESGAGGAGDGGSSSGDGGSSSGDGGSSSSDGGSSSSEGNTTGAGNAAGPSTGPGGPSTTATGPSTAGSGGGDAADSATAESDSCDCRTGAGADAQRPFGALAMAGVLAFVAARRRRHG